MGIRIDQLDPTNAPSRNFWIPAMDGGLSRKLSAGQILDLLVGAAPGSLNTLQELAAAINNDPAYFTTAANSLAAVQSLLQTDINSRVLKNGGQLLSDLDANNFGVNKLVAINGGPFAGFRNKLGNPRFLVNQRNIVYTSTALTAGQHWMDYWKAGTGGCTLSAVASTGVATITAGTLRQIIDGNDIETGNYVINWTGTATCTVDGVAKTKGQTAALTRGTQCIVEFGTGTLSFPQLELGATATSFEHRPLSMEQAICGWRDEIVLSVAGGYQGVASVNFASAVPMRPKRATPTVAQLSIITSSNVNSAIFTNVTAQTACYSIVGSPSGAATVLAVATTTIDARL